MEITLNRWDICKRYLHQIPLLTFTVRMAKRILFRCSLVLAVPFVLILRLLSPILVVRITPIHNQRIGVFSGGTVYQLLKKCNEPSNYKTVDIYFYLYPRTCNSQLDKMWRRTLHVFQPIKYLYYANKWFPRADKHSINAHHVCGVDDKGYMAKNKNLYLSFTDDEIKKGKRFITSLGFSADKKFVCIHARDQHYLAHLSKSAMLYSCTEHRNSDIDTFKKAALFLAEQGYIVFRMGAVVEKPFHIDHPNIIDYASFYRTDFLDIYLGAHCQFHLGDPSGINEVPVIFNRPLGITNLVVFQDCVSSGTVYIPKKFWDNEKKRLLNIEETIIANNIYNDKGYCQFDAHNIELIDNSSNEILELAREMHLRANNEWHETSKFIKQQRTIDKMYSKNFGMFWAKIAGHFLEHNQYLVQEKL